jgi:uncharacterized phiE125 gp8 family phage protein
MLKLVTPPTIVPVSLEEAALEARVSTATDRARLQNYLAAACLDVEGLTGLALLAQTWDLVIVGPFPGVIRVPKPPLASVTSITYVDTSGQTQTVATSVYDVLAENGDTPQPGEVRPKPGQCWPWAARSVTVRFVAGYGTKASDVPATLRLGVLRRIVQHFDGQLDEAAMVDLLGRYILTVLA